MPKDPYNDKTKFAKMEVEYITTSKSLMYLSDKYKIAPSTVRRLSTDNNWVKKREEYLKSVVEDSIEEIKNEKIKEITNYNAQTIKIAMLAYNVIEDQISKKNIKPQEIRSLLASLKDANELINESLGLGYKDQEQSSNELQELIDALKETKLEYEE